MGLRSDAGTGWRKYRYVVSYYSVYMRLQGNTWGYSSCSESAGSTWTSLRGVLELRVANSVATDTSPWFPEKSLASQTWVQFGLHSLNVMLTIVSVYTIKN